MMGAAMNVQKELMSIPDFGNDEEGAFTAEIKAVKNMKKKDSSIFKHDYCIDRLIFTCYMALICKITCCDLAIE